VGRVEQALASHIVKEEGTTWAKLDKLAESLSTMQTSNEVAHASLGAGQAVLGSRVESLEQKMPNGELQKLAEAVAMLSVGMPAGKKRSVRGKK
jgi:hypothetical protein